MGGGKSKGYSESLHTWKDGIKNENTFTQVETNSVDKVSRAFDAVFNSNTSNNPDWPKYPRTAVEQIQQELMTAHSVFGGTENDVLPIDADVPRPFTGD